MQYKNAELIRCYYSSFGPKLTQDILNVEFEVEGETYTHELPNKGWSLKTTALQFMGYTGIQPTDFEHGSYLFGEGEYIDVLKNDGEYYLPKKLMVMGATQLDQSDWFNPEGDVYNTDGSRGVGGFSVDPSTGNRGAVDVEEMG